jgi:hypothetical protein
MASCVSGNLSQCVVSTRCILQTKTRHCLASLNQVQVSIDKGRSDQPSPKINFGLPGRCLSGCLVAADEADRSLVGDHSTRTWLVRRVNASPDEDHK